MKRSAAEILAAELGGSDDVRKPPPPWQAKTGERDVRGREGAFALANRVPVREILDRLGIAHTQTNRGEMATCPGCGEDGALLCANGGIKCLHQRCAHVGPLGHPGFRTNVDMVAEREQCPPTEAARLICAWFDLSFTQRLDVVGSDAYEHSDDDAPDAPPEESQASAKPRALPFLWVKDFGELMSPPKLRWLFRDTRSDRAFIRAGKCYALSGGGGVGKGFATLQVATSIATGRDLFGAFRPEQSGRVAILAAEDDKDEIHHRLFRITNALGISDFEALRTNIGVFPLSGEQVNLLTIDASKNQQRTEVLAGLIAQLASMAKEGGFEWSLIVIDPLARFGAANVEVDQTAATAFVAALEHLAEQVPGGPAVQVNHHSSAASIASGKSNMRGVTGLHDAFRCVLSLDAFRADGLRGVLLRNPKNNLAPEADPLWLVRLENEPMGGGRYLETAGAFRPASDAEVTALEAVAGTNAAASRERREQAKQSAKASKFGCELEAIVDCLPAEPASMGRDELLAALGHVGRGCTAHTLAPRIADLLKSGRVVDLSDGKKSSPRRYSRSAG